MVEKKPRKKAPRKKAAPKQEVIKELGPPTEQPAPKVEVRDEPEGQVLEPILSGTASPAYGTAPYADKQEVSGKPVVVPIVDVARPFFATDARSVMVTIRPNHWNFIKNPSFRVNTNGWKVEKSPLDTAIWTVDAGVVGSSPTYNVLTDNVASGTDTLSATTGFVASSNITLASATAQFAQGARSLSGATTGTSAVGPLAGGSSTSGTLAVVPGYNYVFTVAVRSATVAESFQPRIYWWTSAGNVAASTAYTDGTAATSTTTGWTTYTMNAVAPPNAGFASLYMRRVTGASGVTHYFDKWGFWLGANGTWVMPGTPVPDKDPEGLLDNSGGGRHLLFGQGATAPIFRPHTGEDYLYLPDRVVTTHDTVTTAAKTANFNNVEVVIKGLLKGRPNGSPASIIQVGGTTTGFGVAILPATNLLQVRRAGATTPTVSTNIAPTKLWNRFTHTGATGITLWEHSDDGAVWTTVYTANHAQINIPQSTTQTSYLGGGTMFVPAGAGTRYYASIKCDGVMIYEFKPENVSSDHMTVANTGTLGGVWTITRVQADYRAAIVDRPLVLFGGGQIAAVMGDGLKPQFTGNQTLLMVSRQFANSTAETYLISSIVAASGNGFVIDQVNDGSMVAGAYVNSAPFGMGTANYYGQRSLALRASGTSLDFVKDGTVVGNITTTARTAPATGALTVGSVSGGPAAGASMEFIAAAFWDRVLSLEEITKASAAMAAGSVPVDTPASLDADDSWVGKSLVINGDGMLHYRDVDKDGKPAYVYIGFIENLTTDEYQESVRMSSAWTFSAYVKGTGRVRVVMDAYESAEPWIVGSPPINQNLIEVADPSTTNYGDAKVVAPDGKVWTRNDPPFYLRLGVVPTATVSPDQINTSILMAPVVVDDTGSVWELTSPYPTQAPYYTNWGIPPINAAPGSALPAAGKYIKEADGTLYHLISPAPGAVPYYETMTPPVHPRPEFLVPDKSQFSRYYVYGTNLWQIINPIPEAVPYYSNVGAITTLTTEDPATMPPAGLYVKKAEPNGAYGVWMLQPKPYYTNSGSSKFLATVSSQWLTLQDQADWVRVLVSTSASFNIEYNPVSFAGCSWVDCRVEVEDATTLKVSSLMLDPSELVIAEYFDGSMTESEEVDDYLWEDEAAPNNSVSWYYYDRKSRVEWLWQNLQKLIPVNRPLQIYFEDYEHPFKPSASSQALARHTKTAKV